MTPLPGPAALLACAVVLAVSVVTDLQRRTIPNAITLPALGCGCLYLWLLSPGVEGLLLAVAGALTGGGLLFPPHGRGLVGGGDLKLLAALGAWTGPANVFSIFLYATVVGGLMAAIQLWRRRRQARFGSGGAPSLDLPYAVAIAGGFFLFLLRGRLV